MTLGVGEAGRRSPSARETRLASFAAIDGLHGSRGSSAVAVVGEEGLDGAHEALALVVGGARERLRRVVQELVREARARAPRAPRPGSSPRASRALRLGELGARGTRRPCARSCTMTGTARARALARPGRRRPARSTIASASVTAACRWLRRLPARSCRGRRWCRGRGPRASATSGSTSRGTAKSTTNIGRRRRALSARSKSALAEDRQRARRCR